MWERWCWWDICEIGRYPAAEVARKMLTLLLDYGFCDAASLLPRWPWGCSRRARWHARWLSSWLSAGSLGCPQALVDIKGGVCLFMVSLYLFSNVVMSLYVYYTNMCHFSLLTFGVGKRSCIGEMIARIRMFLFTTALLQSFDLKPGDTKLPSMDPRTFQQGLILTPQPYTMRTIHRWEANSGNL